MARALAGVLAIALAAGAPAQPPAQPSAQLQAPVPPAAAPPALDLLLDTSGSLTDQDPRRYALHFAKALALTAAELGTAPVSARWSVADACGDGAVSRAAFDPADPAAFATALDAIPWRGPNRFGAPLAAAAAELRAGATLLLLADDGGRSVREQREQVDAEIARRVLAAGGRHDGVDVRVSLLWNTKDDLDLHVVAPSGEVIWFRHPGSRCGGALDVDRNANAATRSREPVENVRWLRGQAPAGNYKVLVRNFAFGEEPRQPVPFTVEIEVGGKVYRHQGIASPNRETGTASEQVVAEFGFTPTPPAPAPDTASVAASLSAADRALNPTATGCPDPAAELDRLAAAGVGLMPLSLGGDGHPFAGLAGVGAPRRLASQADLVAAVAAVTGPLTSGRAQAPVTLAQGAGAGRVEVPIPPHQGRVWLLVSGDTDLAGLRFEHDAGDDLTLDPAVGRTLAVDGRTLTSFRVVRLDHPLPGSVSFETSDGAPLAWLAILRPALALRALPPPVLLKDRPATLTLEVRDPAADAPLTDPDRLAALTLTADLDGAPLALQPAGAGRFQAEVRPAQTGALTFSALLVHDGMTRTLSLPLTVGEAVWRFEPALPARHRRETPLLLSGRLSPLGPASAAGQPRPTAILAQGDSGELRLNDAGRDGDATAGDGLYSAFWTPAASGEAPFTFTGEGGAPMLPVGAAVTVIDWAELRGPARLDLGELTSGARPSVAIDLTGSQVRGAVELTVGLEGDGAGVPLRLTTTPDGGPLPLKPGATSSIPLTGAPAGWTLHARVPRCPPRLAADAPRGVLVLSTGADGPGQTLRIPLTYQTQPLHWFLCLLPWLVGGALVIAALVIVWGFVSPARFPRTLGLVLSPEEDLEEGFFQLLRARRGTGSGFYRDARAYIGADFRVSGQRAGAVACLIAGRPRPRLKPLPGQGLERRDADGDWTAVTGEPLALTGTLYRTETGSLYFELRNA